jgi:hypothetical protein
MIIALNLVIFDAIYRHTPQFMIIARTCDNIIIALTHAAICDYRLEPGDIDIIITLTHAA